MYNYKYKYKYNYNNDKESRPVVTYAFLLYPFLEHHFHV